MPKFSVKKPLTVFVAMLAVIVLGVVAYLKMTPDLLPNMDFPYVIIITTDPGASPESVEQEITRPMEQSMATLDDIKSVSSSSQNSVSMVTLEFEDGVNMDTIGVDIQQKISVLQGNWDEMVGAPYVLKINPSMLPVMVAAISSEEMNVDELSTFVEDTLEDQLNGITGVASVDVSGKVTREAHVILSQEKMDTLAKKLKGVVNDKLDEAEKQLKKARTQVTDAQAAIARAEQDAVDEIVDQVVDAATDGVKTANKTVKKVHRLGQAAEEYGQTWEEILDVDQEIVKWELSFKDGKEEELSLLNSQRRDLMKQQQALEEEMGRLTDTIKEQEDWNDWKETVKALVETEQARANGWKELWTRKHNPNPDETVREEISYWEQECAALKETEKELVEKLQSFGQESEEKEGFQWEEPLEKVEETLDNLVKKGTLAKLGNSAGDAVVGVMDALTQIVSGNIKLEDALTQIDNGLTTIETVRKGLDQQTDLSGKLNISTIQQLLTAQNFAMPAGYIDDNAGISYMVNVGDEIQRGDDLRNLVLMDLGLEGMEPIHLGDVAEVVIRDNADEIYTKLNGKNDVIVTFTKQSNYATAEVSQNVMKRFEKLEQEYDGLRFVPLMDQGDYIYLIVDTILSSLLWGALFSVIVLFIFLRDWRPTVITLVSIPISLVFAVVLMYFSGVTINMISLSGLAVSVGMLVDNSVVVIENIYRLRAKGATVIQAAVSGAGQVVGAITASTLTTVCVFLPIVFVEGITKRLFTDLALTMSFALMASLIVALTLVPAMASGLLVKDKPQKKGLLDKIYPLYGKALVWSLGHKALVLLLALVLLVSSGAAALMRGFVFMPEMDMNMISGSIAMPENCTMEQAADLADQVCERARSVEGVEEVGAMIGGSSLGMLGGGGDSSYDVTFYITMPEGASGLTAGKQIEELCKDLPCEVKCDGISSMMNMMTGGSGISLRVYGENMEDLQSAAQAIGHRMEQVPGTAEVSNGLEDAAPAIHITIDRAEAMKHGLTVAQVYMQIAQSLTNSAAGTAMTLDEQKVDVILESAEESRITLETLEKMKLTADHTLADAMGGMTGMSMDSSAMSALAAMSGEEVQEEAEEETQDDGTFTLGEIAKVSRSVSLNSISHSEQRRCITVSSGIAEGYNVTLVTDQVIRALQSLELPAGVSYEFSGENEAIMEAIRQLGLMLLLGIVLVYFIMVAQFQSLKSPFIVMFTIPLAFTGGFLALLIAGFEVSVVSMIGFVMLVGIIVNNGIVLVDYINQLRQEGMAREKAILQAGITRMRPILMTSLTTILGLIVMALAQNIGTSLMQPVALVCIGGLLYATLMTLFVVPCIYDMMNKKELRKVNEEELEILDE